MDGEYMCIIDNQVIEQRIDELSRRIAALEQQIAAQAVEMETAKKALELNNCKKHLLAEQNEILITQGQKILHLEGQLLDIDGGIIDITHTNANTLEHRATIAQRWVRDNSPLSTDTKSDYYNKYTKSQVRRYTLTFADFNREVENLGYVTTHGRIKHWAWYAD